MALCDDMEARQAKQRDKAARWSRAALGELAAAEGPEELAQSWKHVEDNFAVLLDAPDCIAEEKNSVLDLAVRGHLVRQDPTDEPGAALLKRVAERREELIAQGAMRSGNVASGKIEETYSVPGTWSWARVGDAFDVAGGIQKTQQRAPRQNHHPYLRVENVQRGRLDLTRMERFELEEGELARKKLHAGDLLVVEGNGSENEVGRCAIWDGSISDCVHQNHIIRCRPISPMRGSFALLFLNSPAGVAEMKRLAVTTSGLYNLSVGKIRDIAIPVPPLAEQQRILAKVERFHSLCSTLEAALRHAEDKARRAADALVAELLA
jgi:type I restriction enzyme S subunit